MANFVAHITLLRKMDYTIRIMTHESIIHSQIVSIERLLEREINCQPTLNAKGVKSNIEFRASTDEIEKVRTDLGYRVLVEKNGQWLLAEEQ
jgi:hypothetical protein